MLALLAHRSPPVLDGMSTALRARTEIDEIVTARSSGECVDLAGKCAPEVAVIDRDLAPGATTEMCRCIAELGVAVVVISRAESPDHLALLEAGVSGLVLAGDGLDALTRSVESVVAGHAYLPPHLLGGLLRGLIVRRREHDDADVRLEQLSPRELEVLGLLGLGEDHRQIAARLVISPHTAKTHIQRLLRKLGVHSRIEAAAFAVARGITPTHEELGYDEYA